MNPPPVQVSDEAKRRRMAILMNLAFPGTGQIYLGRKVTGSLLAFFFLVSFVVVIGLMLTAFASYFSGAVSDDVLAAGRLEEMGDLFRNPWMYGGIIAAILIALVSLVEIGLRK